MKGLFMQLVSAVENYIEDRFLIDVHKCCNFIPFVSTISNTIAAVQKVIFAHEFDEVTLQNKHYYKYLVEQDFEKDWLLFVPIANMVFSIVKWATSLSSSDNSSDRVDELAILTIKSANDYYFVPPRYGIPKVSEIEDRDALAMLIHTNDIDGLRNSPLLKKYGVNYGFGESRDTLLHIAYMCNKPEIVNWLIENGASEQICNRSCLPPVGYAPLEYKDSRARVVNEIAKRYFEQCGSSVKDPHILYDVILKFISEKKWSYCDSLNRRKTPFRDEDQVVIFGLPSLSYNVNCVSLSSLFVHVAKEVGINATSVFYYNYRSISPQWKIDHGIEGDFKMFDDSGSGPFNYDMHNVAFAEGYHFDLTMMCKYKDKDAVLRF